MPTCPNCGSYVPLGNHSCSCGTSMGGSRRSNYYDEEEERNSGTRSFFDHLTTYEQYALFYENSLSLARRTPHDEFAIRYYKEAVEHGFDYWKEIEDKPYVKPTIPKTNELLSSEDLEKCGKLCYSTFGSILSYQYNDDLEELLTKTGNKQVYDDAYNKWNNDRKEAIEDLKQMKSNAEKKVKSFFSEMGETYVSGAKKIYDEIQKPYKSNKENKSKDSKRIRIKID